MRWTIESDGDSREYLVPVARVVEFEDWLAQIEPGDPPTFAFLIEGGDLTFERPVYDGQPVGC